MSIGFPSYSFSVLTWNVHLFGRTALYQQGGLTHETPFYYRDEERFPQIVRALRQTEASVVGLTEVWDDEMRAEMVGSLKDLYPYHATSPAAPGIGRAIMDFQENWPQLAEALFGARGGVVNRFTRGHYTPETSGCLAGLMHYFSEVHLPKALSRWLRSGPVWGAGLLLLSRSPIVAADFHPHETRTDWEVLADKGVLEATVQVDRGLDLTFSLGHYQEGVSSRAAETRGRQIHRARTRTQDRPSSLIHFGDFNVPAVTHEYRSLKNIMSLKDVDAGDTYREPNPFQDKLQAPRSRQPHSQRIDYIFHSPDLLLRSAKVLREELRSEDGEYGLSDHDALLAEFTPRPELVVPSRSPALRGVELFAAAAVL